MAEVRRLLNRGVDVNSKDFVSDFIYTSVCVVQYSRFGELVCVF